MRKSLAALYTAIALVANGATADTAAVEALRSGDMTKLQFLSEPIPAPATAFTSADGAEVALPDTVTGWTVVNFWATWCAPCREEMPTLSALQDALGPDGLQVVTIATGRNDPAAMQRFFDEIGVANLPLHRDPRQGLARDMGVMGLPVTIILNPEGAEVARLQGDADWNSDSAKAILAALMAGG